jgi:transposase
MGWGVEQLLPTGLQLRTITVEADRVTIMVQPGAPRAGCPTCGRLASRVHRYAQRTLADLPCLGRRVHLRVRARHFYCDDPACPRKIFAERLSGTARVYARRTERLTAALLGLVYESGGEAGAREARRLGMPVSGDTLRRIIHRAPLPPAPRPTVVGVDDWSWRRGQRYGTILVDLERHCPTDLLPERSAESFAAWLAARPGVGVIARDRGNTYAEGAAAGAPDAIQVADRFHLLRNVNEAVERFLLRHHTALQAATEALRQAALDAQAREAPRPPPLPVRERRLTKAAEAKQATHARRQARYDRVRALHRQGLSQREIARTLRMSREAVRTFIRAESCPQYAGGARRRQARILDRFEPYLRRRWDAGCQNAAALYRELCDHGFTGAPETVRYYVRRWRPEGARPGKPARGAPWAPAPPSVPTYSPRQATWVVVKAPDTLELPERGYLEHLCRLCPEVRTVRTLAQEFGRLVRERDRAGLAAWLEAAEGSGIAEIAGIAAGIRQDRAPVDAALALEWSAGQTEGQINRLKVIKRQGYGRAGIDLLRKRVLPLGAIS